MLGQWIGILNFSKTDENFYPQRYIVIPRVTEKRAVIPCRANEVSSATKIRSRNKIITSLIRRCEQLVKISSTAAYSPSAF